MTVSPHEVDTRAGSQSVTITAHMSDDISGVADNWFFLASDTTSQRTQPAVFRLVSGTPRDGTYQATVTVPQGSAPGSWYPGLLELRLQGCCGQRWGQGAGPRGMPALNVSLGAPDSPTQVTATPGNKSATVSWTALRDGGSPITGYTVTPYIGSTAQTTKTVTGTPPAPPPPSPA